MTILLVVFKLGFAKHDASNNPEANTNYQQGIGKDVGKTLLLSGFLAWTF